MRKFILVGADPSSKNIDHPGGQLTASEGLIRYCKENDIEIDLIDTSQSSFPVPSLVVRLRKGINRLIKLNNMLSQAEYSGVIIFSSFGFSFYERIILAALCRVRGVKALFFVRSGHFINAVNASRWNRVLATWLLKIPFRIGAQGQPWVEFYKSLGILEKKLCVVRNWISFDFPTVQQSKNEIPNGPVHFVFVGWVVSAKGIPQLLAAAEMLKIKYNFILTLIGGGTLTEFAKDKENTSLQGSLNVLGWQNAQQVQQQLSKADVFVLPSSAEGFPNALLEAMASGLPAICTDVGAISDSLRNGVNGFLLADNDAESIYDAMEEYIVKPELLLEHSKNTLDIFFKQHDWRKNCEHLFEQFSD